VPVFCAKPFTSAGHAKTLGAVTYLESVLSITGTFTEVLARAVLSVGMTLLLSAR
jgi:hypothetical protein